MRGLCDKASVEKESVDKVQSNTKARCAVTQAMCQHPAECAVNCHVIGWALSLSPPSPSYQNSLPIPYYQGKYRSTLSWKLVLRKKIVQAIRVSVRGLREMLGKEIEKNIRDLEVCSTDP